MNGSVHVRPGGTCFRPTPARRGVSDGWPTETYGWGRPQAAYDVHESAAAIADEVDTSRYASGTRFAMSEHPEHPERQKRPDEQGEQTHQAPVSRNVSIEIIEPPEPDGEPALDRETRVDTMVKDRLLPTARLEDGRYMAWWFDTDAPDPYDDATSEWVLAPTRFLAAATLRELTEDPARFEELLREGDEENARV